MNGGCDINFVHKTTDFLYCRLAAYFLIPASLTAQQLNLYVLCHCSHIQFHLQLQVEFKIKLKKFR